MPIAGMIKGAEDGLALCLGEGGKSIAKAQWRVVIHRGSMGKLTSSKCLFPTVYVKRKVNIPW